MNSRHVPTVLPALVVVSLVLPSCTDAGYNHHNSFRGNYSGAKPARILRDPPLLQPRSSGGDATMTELGMHCRLEPVNESGTKVAMTLENHGDLSIDILTRGNAWDLGRDVFSIQHNDRPVDYRGVLAFRLPPDGSEYMRLEPGQTMTTDYDIARQYRLDESGSYEVWLRSPFVHTRMGDTALLLQHDCGGLLLDLPGEEADIVKLEQPITALTGSACTPAEIDLMTRMDVLAFKLERYRRKFPLLATNTPSDPRMAIYQRWFGPYDYERMDLVDFSFENVISIEENFAFNWFYADCRVPSPNPIDVCTGPVLPGQRLIAAWVNADSTGDDGIIHLCDGFLGGGAAVNAQIGPGLAQVLVHEKIHVQGSSTFSIDYAYGGPNAKDKAVNDPEQAVFNAENYAFYAGDLYLTTAVLTPVLAASF